MTPSKTGKLTVFFRKGPIKKSETKNGPQSRYAPPPLATPLPINNWQNQMFSKMKVRDENGKTSKAVPVHPGLRYVEHAECYEHQQSVRALP